MTGGGGGGGGGGALAARHGAEENIVPDLAADGAGAAGCACGAGEAGVRELQGGLLGWRAAQEPRGGARVLGLETSPFRRARTGDRVG